MSKIEELIAQKCPDGVQYRTIDSVVKVMSPKIKVKSNDYLSEGIYPVVDQGKDFIGGYTNEEGAFEKDEYVIFGDHTCVVKYVDFEFVQGADGVKVLKANNSIVLPRYLYHCMTSIRMVVDYARHWSKMKVKEIPIPPIEVQQEVVSVLDKFTRLEEGLKTELNVRKKQFQYYKTKLLTFDESVPRLKMGEVCNITSGGDVPKGHWSEEKTDDYQIPIYSNGLENDGLYGYTDIPRIEKEAITIAGRGAGVGNTLLRKEPFFPIIRLVSVVPDETIDVKFLYYFVSTIEFKIPQGGIPQLTVPMVSGYEIPIPPLETQLRIVAQLDVFEQLIKSDKYGLLAEIEARHKQYEYYRDKILSFKRVGEIV